MQLIMFKAPNIGADHNFSARNLKKKQSRTSFPKIKKQKKEVLSVTKHLFDKETCLSYGVVSQKQCIQH